MYTNGEWHPGINDPTVFGWVIAAEYVIGAAVCGINAGQAVHAASRRFWITLSGVMLLLGINKQLDFQTFVWLEGRKIARYQGWYEDRIWAQGALSIAIALSGIVFIYLLVRLSRYERIEARVTMLGMVLLCVFVLVRSISYHPVDVFFGTVYGGWKLHRIIEMAGVCTVLVSALISLARTRFRAPRT
ncbi:MAG: hypothetical protein IT366_11565 [Candidatus Hydrogenedentes bacterium]|nr:hypothetical protein [Candidatus Hydrogenedentota bacterium]